MSPKPNSTSANGAALLIPGPRTQSSSDSESELIFPKITNNNNNGPKKKPYSKTSSNTTQSQSGNGENKALKPNDNEPTVIVWRNIILFLYLHIAALYGAGLWISGQVMLPTFFWGFLLYCMCGFGITAGAHRLWAHKSYKAKMPLQIILCLCQTVAFQNHIYEWVRDHRVHHKYSETTADPHNANRGFFFAHIGWLLCKKHKDVKEKGKCIDMSDMENDPVVMFQKKYYLILVLFACFFIPALVPWYFWGESFQTAWFFCAQFRYCITLHMTWLVNSAAHLWGPRPYDVTIGPRENKSVAFWAFGEGWHNYHHTFPWDYKTAELGIYKYNFSAGFIDLFAKIGWAYDLKTVPAHIVKQRVARTGDGSHDHHHHHTSTNKIDAPSPGPFSPGPFGWGDKDIPAEDLAITTTLYTKKLE